jgi:hypothetical protein
MVSGLVSLYTVSRELGHGSGDMVRRVYAHLGTVGTAQRLWSTVRNSTSNGWGISWFGWGMT